MLPGRSGGPMTVSSSRDLRLAGGSEREATVAVFPSDRRAAVTPDHDHL